MSLAYVLNNWRRHREDLASCALQHARLDPYASGLAFDGWTVGPFRPPDGYEPLPVGAPTAWLLTAGWRRHGLLDPFETPGPSWPRGIRDRSTTMPRGTPS
jgi:hypothetical protein